MSPTTIVRLEKCANHHYRYVWIEHSPPTLHHLPRRLSHRRSRQSLKLPHLTAIPSFLLRLPSFSVIYSRRNKTAGKGKRGGREETGSKMGSLPSPSPEDSAGQIDEATLMNLFKAQQDHLNYFFRHLDLSQALSFTRTLLSSPGTIFFSGVGKSGFVARKISHTLVSLGVPSSFLSPLDALHGDIGALSSGDVLVLLSKSGSSEELLRLAPFARERGALLVSVTSSRGSLLDKCCDLSVFLPLERELCPFDLAPVTSTAIQMVFGDTVAVALMSARNFTREVFATNHPAGKIGKSLIFKVKDLMKKQNELPICKEGDMIMDQLVELTSKGCGCLLVIDEAYHLIGTFTDGDLRRTLKASKEGIFNLTVGEMCNRSPRTISPDAMAVEAMKRMESPPSPVQFLPVVDHQNVVIGIVTLHGLVSAGL